MNIKEGDYVKWIGERLEDSGYVSNIFINSEMIPFTDGKPRKVLKVGKSYENIVLLKLEGIESLWNYPVSQIEVVNNNKYITKPIEGYPEWLKDVPRGEAVLCNVWDDEEYLTREYVTAYLGVKSINPYTIKSIYPYTTISGLIFRHAEPILQEKTKLDELKAKYRELGDEIRKLEE